MTARVVIIMNDAAGGNTTAEVQQGSLRPIYLDGIFGVFQRGRNEYEGTRIGLAICRKIVQHHGQSMAKGTSRQGATFS